MSIFEKKKRILYVPPRGIGDLMFSLPLLHSLNSAYKNSEIEVAIPNRESLKQVLEMTGFAKPAEVYLPTPKDDPLAHQRYLASKARDHRAKESYEKLIYDKYFAGLEYDLVILPKRFKIRSLKPCEQVNREDILKKGLDYHTVHEVDGFLYFADVLNIPKKNSFELEFGKDKQVQTIRGRELILPQNYVVFNLGASSEERKWQPEKVCEVSDYLAGQGLTSVIVGTFADYPDALKLKETSYRINLVPKEGITLDLKNYARLASKAKVVIGTDSGLLHLADAVGTKTIGLYGPGDPSNCGPYHNLDRVISRYEGDRKVSNIATSEVINKIGELKR